MLGDIFIVGLVLFVGFVFFCIYVAEIYDKNDSFLENMGTLFLMVFIVFVVVPWFFGLPIFKIIFK